MTCFYICIIYLPSSWPHILKILRMYLPVNRSMCSSENFIRLLLEVYISSTKKFIPLFIPSVHNF